MVIPDFLKPNSRIRVVAPAGKVKRQFVSGSVAWLRSRGFEVVVGNHVFDVFNQFAGRDDDRRADLQDALDDPNATVIICARGGYGTARLIDRLDFSHFLENPKWLAGFSDITVLHNRLNNLGVASIHGAMLRHFNSRNGEVPEKIRSLFFLLEGGKPEYHAKYHKFNREGRTKAELAGGNLSIIYSLRGTPVDLKTNGKILFLEEVGEYLYHTDRMLRNLKLGGKLANLAGLVVGEFSKMKDNDSPYGKEAYEIIAEAVQEYDYPVCFGFPAGHGRKNLALAFGRQWELAVGPGEVTLRMA